MLLPTYACARHRCPNEGLVVEVLGPHSTPACSCCGDDLERLEDEERNAIPVYQVAGA